MGSCIENCVYRANNESERVNPETGAREVWCAKLRHYVELNGTGCLFFVERKVRNGQL